MRPTSSATCRARTSSRSIFWTVSLSSGLIALLLSVMGVLLASRGDMSDPIAGVEPFVPGWLFVLYILAAAGGSIANNVGRVLLLGPLPAGGRACRSSATRPPRWTPWCRPRWCSTSCSCTTSRPCCTTSSRCWSCGSGPFGGRVDHRRADAPLALRPGGDPRPRAAERVTGAVARRSILAAGSRCSPAWRVCLLTINAPILQGPVSERLAGADLTWTLGPLVSALAYWAWRQAEARADQLLAPAPRRGTRLRIQLAVDPAHVGLDRVAGDVQLLADLGDRQLAAQQPQHRHLARWRAPRHLRAARCAAPCRAGGAPRRRAGARTCPGSASPRSATARAAQGVGGRLGVPDRRLRPAQERRARRSARGARAAPSEDDRPLQALARRSLESPASAAELAGDARSPASPSSTPRATARRAARSAAATHRRAAVDDLRPRRWRPRAFPARAGPPCCWRRPAPCPTACSSSGRHLVGAAPAEVPRRAERRERDGPPRRVGLAPRARPPARRAPRRR